MPWILSSRVQCVFEVLSRQVHGLRCIRPRLIGGLGSNTYPKISIFTEAIGRSRRLDCANSIEYKGEENTTRNHCSRPHL